MSKCQKQETKMKLFVSFITTMTTPSETTVGQVINITRDGQVQKRILREGAGETPVKNSTVSGMST